jgi:hypothetical protein
MTINTESDKERIREALNQVSNSLTSIETERDHIKDIIKALSDEFNIPKRTMNKLARVYHKQTFIEEKAIQEEFEELYENVVK